MPKLRVIARLSRLLLVLLFGLLMASAIALGERLGVKTSLERRQRWTCLFMKRLVAALPFEVRVLGELPKRPMLWVSNHVSWTDIPLLGMLLPLSFLGGVFYSIDSLPSPWHELSHANPLFFLISAVRYGFLGHSEVAPALALAVTAAFAAVTVAWSSRLFATGRRLKP